MRGLDQFYTKSRIAKLCYDSFKPVLRRITGNNVGNFYFIEPSVGLGNFFDLLPKNNKVGIDLDPKREIFVGGDYLLWDYRPLSYNSNNTIVIGNPPFGKRGKLAIDFFNKSAEIADTIAFILPVIFKKFFIHKQLNSDFQWVDSTNLPRDAFYTEKQKDYEVNTEFQVWTRIKNNYKNLRLFNSPPIRHPDFDMWQYNNTKDALKVFENCFDFAVPSQGWQDYSRREKNKVNCEKNKQWVLFKTHKETIFERLYEDINYETLAYKNTTSIPGFRKGDIVQEYSYKYD